MKSYKIAVLPGDGIGKEIMPEALKVLHATAEKLGAFAFEFEQFLWGCEYSLETGQIMPPNGIDILRQFDAIYFVAAGHPAVCRLSPAVGIYFSHAQAL